MEGFKLTMVDNKLGYKEKEIIFYDFENNLMKTI